MNCYLCPRTPVTYLSGLYKGEGQGGDGVSLDRENHPHPNLPPEGEGVSVNELTSTWILAFQPVSKLCIALVRSAEQER